MLIFLSSMPRTLHIYKCEIRIVIYLILIFSNLQDSLIARPIGHLSGKTLQKIRNGQGSRIYMASEVKAALLHRM